MVSSLYNQFSCPHCGQRVALHDDKTTCSHCHMDIPLPTDAPPPAEWPGQAALITPGPSPIVPMASSDPQELAVRRTSSPLIVGSLLGAVLIIGALGAHLVGVETRIIQVMAVIIAALGFDFVNGMNDSGNAIATVISTRVLTPVTALIMAALLNFVGALIMEGVAKNIAGKIVHTPDLASTLVTPLMILCGLLGAIAWAFTMARIGMPISTSHALIGGVIGTLLVGHVALNYVYIREIVTWMIVAPVLGITLGWAFMVGILWAFHRV